MYMYSNSNHCLMGWVLIVKMLKLLFTMTRHIIVRLTYKKVEELTKKSGSMQISDSVL